MNKNKRKMKNGKNGWVTPDEADKLKQEKMMHPKEVYCLPNKYAKDYKKYKKCKNKIRQK